MPVPVPVPMSWSRTSRPLPPTRHCLRLRVPRASTAASPVTTPVTVPRKAAPVDPAAARPMVAGGRAKADTKVAVEVKAVATAAVDVGAEGTAGTTRTGVEFPPVPDSLRTSLSKSRATIGVSIASVGRRLMERPGTPGPSHARLTLVSPPILVLGSPSANLPLLAPASASFSLASSPSSCWLPPASSSRKASSLTPRVPPPYSLGPSRRASRSPWSQRRPRSNASGREEEAEA
jgi:hypothetical protein